MYCLWISRFPNTIYWKDDIFFFEYSWLFCWILIDHICVSLFLCSGFSCPVMQCNLFLFLFVFLLCQYHTVLINIALPYSLKSGSMMPIALFFPKVDLTIWGLLWFHMNLVLFFPISMKNCHWNFDRDCIESIHNFVLYGHFNNVNSSDQQIQYLPTHLCFLKFLSMEIPLLQHQGYFIRVWKTHWLCVSLTHSSLIFVLQGVVMAGFQYQRFYILHRAFPSLLIVFQS